MCSVCEDFGSIPPERFVSAVSVPHEQRKGVVAVTIRVLLAAMAAFGILGFGFGVTVAPVAQADPPYANCKAAAKDGRYNIPRGDPAYGSWLDRDNDGIACESK